MPRPYDPDLLNAILNSLPAGTKISKIYYLPSISSGDNYDQIPVLLPKWKANEILRWIESEANKLTTKADARFGKPLVRETKRTRPTFIDPTDLHTGTDVVGIRTGSLPRNTFTAPDSLD
ncbi:hypothetical protein GL50803_002011 [Giardia duodenalis]|uniref:Uncharacterized protein n=1 Tax=Giardia intestinalis (strain ATCC 50803 / WB clone C6) TaxID=184922 RepID=A8B7C4_GIAIC|nr:hypothetical protein GL50803_002011 [Giardia intestinalis]KAE8301737.1 hypothetical protein GL50803_002011 [Giardia intestinalis]|eukprot:XP_001709194.1 Hypothetical protein GL50803_2011 [Giardia lamblia ATCC 50803]